jgi:hypothetical protein
MPAVPKGGVGGQVLGVPMDPKRNDANAKDIRGYLKALLTRLWQEEEGFSGKRPLGNSGWQNEVVLPLYNAEMIKGKVDSEGCVYDYDQTVVDGLMLKAIKAL